MLATGIHVGLGTDGCASNNNLDMFEEVNLAALVSKAVTHNPVVVPAREALAMATIQGAKALHLDQLIGSIEPGKRADLAILEATSLHTVPHFDTTGLNLYSQLVYSSKSDDVRHVLINGRVVMRDRQLLTLNEESILAQVRQLGDEVNLFFVKRETSLLEKVAAIGGLEREESYQVQVKARVLDKAALEARIRQPEIAVVRESVREQYDTYLMFADPNWGMLRHREDVVIGANNTLSPIYTLTVMGPTKERDYGDAIVLSRSRLTAPADRTLRFYREYFRPSEERQVSKKRFRYRIRYRGVDFAVNLDQITQPAREGWFLEVKSRTWSSRDAERKATLISELLKLLDVQPEHLIREDYVDWAVQ
jgi:5-methylthioadenosine/S-adenosylhomocysteine deaminase